MNLKQWSAVGVLLLCAGAVFAAGSKEARAPETSIHEAALIGDTDAIRQHIRAGTDIDMVDQYGSTPLIIAATFGNAEVARVLVDAGADLEIPNDEGSTPLHIAAFLCREEIARMLLDAGADVGARNAAGLTPLDMVSGPFADAQPIYSILAESLAPLGLKLDFVRLERTRPEMAALLGS